MWISNIHILCDIQRGWTHRTELLWNAHALQRNTLTWSRQLYVTMRKSSIVLEFDGFPHNEALSLIWKHWGFQGCWLPWRFTHQRLEMKLCSCEEIKRNTPGSQFSPKSKKNQILHYLDFWYKFRFFLHCALFVCAFLCIALFFITINNFIPQIL